MYLSNINDPSTWPNKLFISIPISEICYSRFWQQLHTVQGYGYFVQQGLWSSLSGQIIHDGHNKLLRDALKIEGWDRLLWLETDHDFQPDMLYKHAHYTEPIVGGLYVQRKVDEPLPVIYNWDLGRHNALRPSRQQMKRIIEEPGLHEVDIVPSGCTSIRRDVLEDWPQGTPHYFSPTNPDTGTTMTDDVWFCRKAQDQGYPIYVDSSNLVSHYALFPVEPKFFIQWDNHHNQIPPDYSKKLIRIK